MIMVQLEVIGKQQMNEGKSNVIPSHGDAINDDSGKPKTKKWFSLPEVDRQGIVPIPDDQRPHTRLMDNFTIWFSINSSWVPLTIGMLATLLYRITFWQGLLCIIFANIVAAIPGGIFATFGPRYGTRQIVLSRYSYGLLPCYLLSILNWFGFVGWTVLGVVLGAQLISEVQPQIHIPLWAGCIIIAAVMFVVSIFGYSTLHFFERWTWIPLWIVIFIILGISVPHLDISATDSFISDRGDVTSFFTTIVASQPVWTACAADFTTKQPSTTDNHRRFWTAFLTIIGAIIPAICFQTLGFSLATAIAEPNQNPLWRVGYESNSVGGFVNAILKPLSGFGQFCLIVLLLGVLTNILPDVYGGALVMQAIAPGLYKIPLWVFTISMVIIVAIISIAGSQHVPYLLQVILAFQVYYVAPYAAVILIEHFVFRRGHYPIEIWNTRKELPIGLAATLTTMGAYGCAFLGANQSWFQGPLARRIGDHGGEVGLWIAILFAVCVYPPARYLEKRTFHR